MLCQENRRMANWADPTAAAFVTLLEAEWRWEVLDVPILIDDLLDSGITVEVDPNDVLSNILAAFNTVASQETRELGKEICEQIIYCKGVLDRCVEKLIKIKEYDAMFPAQPSRAKEFCDTFQINFWWGLDITNLFFAGRMNFLGQVFPRMTSEERLSVYDKACLFDENLKLFYNRYQWHAAYLDVTLNPP